MVRCGVVGVWSGLVLRLAGSEWRDVPNTLLRRQILVSSPPLMLKIFSSRKIPKMQCSPSNVPSPAPSLMMLYLGIIELARLDRTGTLIWGNQLGPQSFLNYRVS
jgi:hypothetical protein